MRCSPSGISVHGISQARILEWVAISSSRGSSNPGIKPVAPALQADSLLLSHWGSIEVLIKRRVTSVVLPSPTVVSPSSLAEVG